MVEGDRNAWKCARKAKRWGQRAGVGFKEKRDEGWGLGVGGWGLGWFGIWGWSIDLVEALELLEQVTAVAEGHDEADAGGGG